jgi:hypothetical protein
MTALHQASPRTIMPLVGRCLDSLWFGTAKDHVLEGVWAILQDPLMPPTIQPAKRAANPD